MNNIPSFTVNHLTLQPGLYVSRKDYLNNVVLTTFDIRMTAPNREPVLDTDVIHAIEHLGAVYLRNHQEWSDKVIYFGPMGCRTGFYLILHGDLTSTTVLPLIIELFDFIVRYQGEIPGAKPEECGNYRDMSLEKAKHYAGCYLEALNNIDESRLSYYCES